jgi:hypothetical protein
MPGRVAHSGPDVDLDRPARPRATPVSRRDVQRCGPTAAAVLHLQRTAGNGAVATMLGRRGAGRGVPVQRRTDPVHLRPTRPGAQGCLVHLHGDETSALSVARDLYRSHCVNLVYIDHPGRRLIDVDVPGHRGLTCRADPNRVFDDAAITSQWTLWNTGACLQPGVRPDAEAAVRGYRDAELLPRIGQCRGDAGGGGSTGGTPVGSLPVVAFHNNSPGSATAVPTRKGSDCKENLTIRSYLPGHCEETATETDPARLTGTPTPTVVPDNPAIVAGQDVDNFFLVTDPREFRALRTTRNVVLQVVNPPNDGSLSVALSTGRYVNVEAESTDRTKPVNTAMGTESLTALGIGPLPCPGQPLPPQQAGKQAGHVTSADLAGTAGTPASREDFMRDVYDRQVTLAKVRYTGSVPAADLSPLPTSYVGPGRRVKMHKDVAPAMASMLDAVRAALARDRGLTATDAASRTLRASARRVSDIGVLSGYRPAKEQLGIWQRFYPRYYAQTEAARARLAGGPHGDAAVDLLARYINVRVHSPGFSAHQVGRTADLAYRDNGVWNEASTADADMKKWKSSWLFAWLLKNAPGHGFAQNPDLDEPWHWEHP